MVFTKKNLQAKKSSMSFMKGATLFFLGMSAIMFMVRAFDVGVMAPNAVQYIQKVFLTSDGSNVGTTGIILDGSNGNGHFIGMLDASIVSGTTITGTTINGTNINASLVKATGISGTILTGATICLSGDCRTVWPSGGVSGANYYTTGMSFNSGNNVLTLYVSGTNAVTGQINLSGVISWNAASSRVVSSGGILRNRYTNTGIYITSIATLTCSLGEIAKATSTGWDCGTDLTGAGAGGSSLRSTGASFAIYYNSGNVGIGTATPSYKLDVRGSINATGAISIHSDTYGTVPDFEIYSAGTKIGQIGSNWISNAPDSIGMFGKDGVTLGTIGNWNSLFVSTGGNVGIGTTSPSTKLSVFNGGTIDIAPDLANAYINISAPGIFDIGGMPRLTIGYLNTTPFEGGYLWSRTGSGLVISASVTTLSPDIVVTPAGNVGIGTGTPSAKIHVIGKGKFTNSVQVGSPETNRCTALVDAGKIIYTVPCYGSSSRTPMFIGCVGSGASAVVAKILMTGNSYGDILCPVGIDPGLGDGIATP